VLKWTCAWSVGIEDDEYEWDRESREPLEEEWVKLNATLSIARREPAQKIDPAVLQELCQ